MSRNEPDNIILPSDPEAATYRTNLSGWVSRDGMYFGTGAGAEKAARWRGCTHVPCGRCGATTSKGRVLCPSCLEITEREKYAAMPKAEWDGEAMLYSMATDRYFHDLDAAEDSLDDGETLEGLRLVICEPNYARTIDDDFFEDELAYDADLPREVLAAMEAFNKAVAGIVLSWSPGKFALKQEGES